MVLCNFSVIRCWNKRRFRDRYHCGGDVGRGRLPSHLFLISLDSRDSLSEIDCTRASSLSLSLSLSYSSGMVSFPSRTRVALHFRQFPVHMLLSISCLTSDLVFGPSSCKAVYPIELSHRVVVVVVRLLYIDWLSSPLLSGSCSF